MGRLLLHCVQEIRAVYSVASYSLWSVVPAVNKHLLEGNCAKRLRVGNERPWRKERKENVVSRQEESNGAGARAVAQVRDGEEAAGMAAQHRKQTEFLFLAGLGRADKGPCCELRAACSWQAVSAALQVGLCLSASVPAASISLETSTSASTHPFHQKKSLGQQQRRTWGPLTPRSKHRLLSVSAVLPALVMLCSC